MHLHNFYQIVIQKPVADILHSPISILYSVWNLIRFFSVSEAVARDLCIWQSSWIDHEVVPANLAKQGVQAPWR